MADCYQPADEQATRRSSYSNSTLERETRRPPIEARCFTMDPRNRPKRNPSRSPEGPPARKQVKPDHPGDVWVQRRDTEDITPRSPTLADAPSKDIARANNGSQPNSPGASRLSANRSTSGRSTPVQRTSSISSDVASQDSILDLLTRFSTQTANQASLQVACDQAKARNERAQLEYNENRAQFAIYPAIKERKSNDKAAAQKDLDAKESRLREHKVSQAQVTGALATLIGQLQAEKDTSASRTDLVSRDEFDRHLVKYNDLRSDANAASARIIELRQTVNEAMKTVNDVSSVAGQIGTLQGQVEKVEASMNGLHEWKRKTQPALIHANELETIVQQAHDSLKTASNRLANFISNDMKEYAKKDAVSKLESKHEQLSQRIDGVQTMGSELLKDVGRFKAEKTAASFAKPNPNSTSDDDVKKLVEKVKQDGPILTKRVEELENTLHSLNTLTRGSDIVNADSSLTSGSGSLREKILSLEQDLQAIQNDIKNLQSSTRPADSAVVTPDATVDIGSLRTRLETVEKDLASFETGNDERDQVIASEMLGVQNTMEARFAQLEEARARGEESNTAALSQLEKKLADVMPSLNDKVGFQVFRSSQDKTKAEIAELRTNTSNRVDGLIGVTNHLRQRCDNITTDDLVRQMSDQMMTMFPAAVNLQGAMTQAQHAYAKLQALHEALAARVTQLSKDNDAAITVLDKLVAEAKTVSAEAKAVSNTAHTAVEQTSTLAIQAKQTAEHLKTEIKTLTTDVQKLKKLSTDLEPEFEGLRIDLDDTTDVARAQQERFDMLDLETMKEQVEDMRKMVVVHEEKLRVGGKELQSAKTHLRAFRGELTEFEGRVEVIDELVRKGEKDQEDEYEYEDEDEDEEEEDDDED